MTIRFTTICPLCSRADKSEFKGMGQSHAAWITELGKTGKYPGWKCTNCKEIVTAKLTGVDVK